MTALSGQIDYPSKMSRGFVGDRSDHGGQRGHLTRPYVNPALAQKNTITVGGTTTAGDYDINITFNVTDVNGAEVRVQGPVLYRFTRAAETDAQIATALVAELNLLSSQWLTAEVDSGTPEQINISFKNANLTHTVATVPPAPGTLVVAQTQAPGGVNLRVGVLVARAIPDGTNDNVLTPIIKAGTPTVVANVVGIAERTTKQYQDSVTDTLEYDIYRTGQGVSVGREGNWNMEVFTDVVVGDTVVMWIEPASGAHVGSVGTGSVTADQIDVSSIVEFVESGSAGDLVAVRMKL